MNDLILRPERPEQYKEMEEIVRDAFWDRFCPGCSEHLVVRDLRQSPVVVPELCLAAELDGRLAGGIWYAQAAVVEGGTRHGVLTMGPVCVSPEYRSRGIGASLIEKTLALAAGKACAVIIYGDPGYYGRFGFRPASDFGITDAEGNFCPAILVRPLAEKIPSGAFDEGSVYHVTPEAVRAFDKTFPPRQKHCNSRQLFFFPPTPPPGDPLLFASWDLRRRAADVLRSSGVLEAWESLGAKVRSVGSFRNGLMMKHRDIDLHVYTPGLDVPSALSALTPVIAAPRTVSLDFVNGSGTEEHCLEWHLKLRDDSGEVWKIDMIQILAGSAYDGVMEDVAEAVIDAATPEMRRTILALKNACPDDQPIGGIEFYKAVIADRVTTWEEFLDRRTKEPPEDLRRWKPAPVR